MRETNRRTKEKNRRMTKRKKGREISEERNKQTGRKETTRSGDRLKQLTSKRPQGQRKLLGLDGTQGSIMIGAGGHLFLRSALRFQPTLAALQSKGNNCLLWPYSSHSFRGVRPQSGVAFPSLISSPHQCGQYFRPPADVCYH